MIFERTSTAAKQWMLALRDRELPYRTIEDRDALTHCPAEAADIPLEVYQSWQDRKLGRSHLRDVEEFRKLNPEFKFHVFSNEDQADFMHSRYQGEDILKVFDSSTHGVMRSDIFRYSMLLDAGGVYLDLSKRLTTPMSQFLHLQSPFVLSHERNPIPDDLILPKARSTSSIAPYLFVQWCLISTRNHRFLVRMIDNICRFAPMYAGVEISNPKLALLRLTSSHMWTQSVWQEIASDPVLDYTIAGFDYHEVEFPRIPGSYVRYLVTGHYASERRRVILRNLDL